MSSIIRTDNDSEYQYLLIKDIDISNMDWHDINYTTQLLNLDIYRDVSVSNDKFANIVQECLYNTLYKQPNIKTEMICVEKGYHYELMYIEELDCYNKENLKSYTNHIAKMLNNNDDDIYFNVLLTKTKLDISTNDMIFVDAHKEDVRDILYDRICPKIVIYDNEWKECRLNNGKPGTVENYCKDFFDEDCKELEISYLSYNLMIYYIENEYASKVCLGLLDVGIEKCIILNMYNSEKYLNIDIDIVKKIIKLAFVKGHLDVPSKYSEKEKYDSKGRMILNTKYKILCDKYNQLFV